MWPVEPHLVIASYYEPGEAGPALRTMSSCCLHHLPHAIVEKDVPEVEFDQYLPWFLLDQIADKEPNRVLYLRAGRGVDGGIFGRLLPFRGADAVLFCDEEGRCSIDAIGMGNTDVSRQFLDTWISMGDESPETPADEHLRRAISKYARIMKFERVPFQILNHRSVACTI